VVQQARVAKLEHVGDPNHNRRRNQHPDKELTIGISLGKHRQHRDPDRSMEQVDEEGSHRNQGYPAEADPAFCHRLKHSQGKKACRHHEEGESRNSQWIVSPEARRLR